MCECIKKMENKARYLFKLHMKLEDDKNILSCSFVNKTYKLNTNSESYMNGVCEMEFYNTAKKGQMLIPFAYCPFCGEQYAK